MSPSLPATPMSERWSCMPKPEGSAAWLQAGAGPAIGAPELARVVISGEGVSVGRGRGVDALVEVGVDCKAWAG